jgi:hypothetical protein
VINFFEQSRGIYISKMAEQHAWFLQSNFPVLFPSHTALTLPTTEFESFLQTDISRGNDDVVPTLSDEDDKDTFTIVSTPPSTTADIREGIQQMTHNDPRQEARQKIREDIKQNIRAEIRKKIRGEIRKQIREKVREDLKEKVRSKIQERIRREIWEKIQREVPEDMQDEIQVAFEEDFDENTEQGINEEVANEEFQQGFGKMDVDPPESETSIKPQTYASVAKLNSPQSSAFMKALTRPPKTQAPPNMENKMFTDNQDIAYRSTQEPLVDLFTELEDLVSGPQLRQLLETAWNSNPLATLKIIFNARSIHLGKSSRSSFYRCAGWLAQNHPLTLVSNLQWLSRPVIQKVAVRKESGEEEMVLVEKEAIDDNDPRRYDVHNGVAHGYWKDLLNILALHVQGKLDVLQDPAIGLYVPKIERKLAWQQPAKGKGGVDEFTATLTRTKTKHERHEQAIAAFTSDRVYRGLHITIARLFAEQLRKDLEALRGDKKALRTISLCAKWAPSTKLFHDKHTFIVSSIAEILHPESEFSDELSDAEADGKDSRRELYLRHAREAYRKNVAALRKHLEVVERELTANTLTNIKYERVPSLAMKAYTEIFATKDTERFDAYLEKVAGGSAKISGAVLLPSTLIKAVRDTQIMGRSRGSAGIRGRGSRGRGGRGRVVRAAPQGVSSAHMNEMKAKVIDGQWRTLLKRIKDSGTLSSSIAVCDVSGSMMGPVMGDGTTPMDSSIGLSLLLAEVTAPPFGGAFITFSESPTVEEVDLTMTLHQKYRALQSSRWGMNTDFAAVFEKLILPLAIENKLRQDEMVKRVFVFSDMQFDQAELMRGNRWSTSYERIEKKFAAAGYEMPEMVFWNLAGGRHGYSSWGEPTVPKPVTAEQPGTAIVSGYSQAMLKVFLDGGGFEELDEEEETVEVKEVENNGEDGEEEDLVDVQIRKKVKMDPMSTVKKAIGHKAYDMLRVVD